MRLCRAWRAATASTATTPAPLRRHCRACSSEPPSPTTFPAWRPLDFFHFEILHQSRRSNARVGRCVDMHMHMHVHMHMHMHSLLQPCLRAGYTYWLLRTVHTEAACSVTTRNTVAPQVGRIHTPHGVIDTPGVVPVGTNAALKHVDQRAPAAAGVQLMFVNTYHMLVHPGSEVVAAAGGLHKFMLRDKPLITDSGGFQIFSMQQKQGQRAMPGDDAPPPAGSCGDAGGELTSSGGELKSSRHPNARWQRRHDAAEDGPNPSGHGGGVRVTEEGVTFRSYRDGTPPHLSPD